MNQSINNSFIGMTFYKILPKHYNYKYEYKEKIIFFQPGSHWKAIADAGARN